ncbi:ProQ/FINO family protein [Paraburkholderia youngii]|uniref:ProQ/FinO family protein n=1 Tax=Paraburkholderia youngii TaxID=2782701 RepID=UPI003D1A0BC1
MGFEQLAELKKQLAAARAAAEGAGKPDRKSAARPASKSAGKPASNPGAHPGSNAERGANPGAKSGGRPGGKPAAKAGGRPDGKPGTRPGRPQPRHAAPEGAAPARPAAVDAKPVDPVVRSIGRLQKRFPVAFPKNPAPKLPLKIGVFEDLVVHAKELSLTEAELRDAIKTWCRGGRYWKSLVEGAARVDLAGVLKPARSRRRKRPVRSACSRIARRRARRRPPRRRQARVLRPMPVHRHRPGRRPPTSRRPKQR